LRKKYSIVLFLIISTFLADNPALASREKPKPPILPPGTIRVVERFQVRVTFYYGPRKNQRRYIHGSYRREVRINGKGEETRSGRAPDIGTAAADWKILPRGTRFRIVGCNAILGANNERASDIIFTVWDTGGGVKRKHVDIFAGFGDPGRKIAENFGRQNKDHFVIEVVR
jgi:3D (Asp-Asp-Asp) domain-containing protein